MKILKFFESFSSEQTFKNTEPSDLVYLTREQIIELISNTFDSEVIEDDPEWTIIRSTWKVIHKDNEMTKLSLENILDIEEYVYFHIHSDDFTIVRGSSDKLQDFLRKAQSIDKSIVVDGGTEGQSLILKGRRFFQILYSLAPIPKGEHSVDFDGDWYSLESMGCGGDIRLDGKKISYYSDLLVGGQIDLDVATKKKHPGLTKIQAMMKDIEERSRPTLQPKIIKGDKDSGIFKGSPKWNEYSKFLVQFSYENMLFDICDDIKKRNIGEYYFENPKHFEKMKFNIHEYEPADVYYAIRISEIQDTDNESESFIFQWFAKLFANEEHLQNHYKKYPHFGPGGSRYTFVDSQGVERLSYQPPMFKNIETSLFGLSSGGDSIGEIYFCQDRDSLFHILEKFNDFMKDNSQSHFETDYPKYKE
jgi:hypothetical protein